MISNKIPQNMQDAPSETTSNHPSATIEGVENNTKQMLSITSLHLNSQQEDITNQPSPNTRKPSMGSNNGSLTPRKIIKGFLEFKQQGETDTSLPETALSVRYVSELKIVIYCMPDPNMTILTGWLKS